MRGKRDSYAVVFATMPAMSVKATVISPPVPLPERMPSIPADLHWMAETIIVADSLAGYPDLIMKLAFLILEELKKHAYWNKDEFEHLEYVRDFVSHPKCYLKKKQVEFIAERLPSSIVDMGAVQFNRKNLDHAAFVSKYASQALRKAKQLIGVQVKERGGFLGD